jgi:hypothetical protein
MLDGLRGCIKSRVPWGPLLERCEIVRRGAVKYVAVRRLALFEKTLFHELLNGLCNFWGPLSNAGVEHPPTKDTVDGVLSVRMSGQIVENFRCRRLKRRGRQAHICVSHPPIAIDVPRNFRCCAQTRIVRLGSLPRVSISPLKMRSPEDTCVRAATRIGVGFGNASEDNFVLASWQIFSCGFVLNPCAGGGTILSTLGRSFARRAGVVAGRVSRGS